MVVMHDRGSLDALPSNTPSAVNACRDACPRCSVDSRGGCTPVLVVAFATNSSASVASPHRLVHLLLHDLRLIGNCLHIALCVFTLPPQANFTCESLPVVQNLFLVTEQKFEHPRGRVESSFFYQVMYRFPSDSSSAVRSSPGSMVVPFLSSATSPCQR